MAKQRIRISLKRKQAITVDRISIGDLRLAYVICADKKVTYGKHRSKIVYIGTTKNGISRVAQSAATQSDAVFKKRGINQFTVHLVTCTRGRQGVKSWNKLERALILQFKDMYGRQPVCNTHGKNYKWGGEEDSFSKKRLKTVIDDLS